MTRIAILGPGRVGGVLGHGLANAGHQIGFGAIDPETARASWPGPGVEFGTVRQAIATAGVVINATPGERALEFLGGLADPLAGKILVDVSNAVERGEEGLPGRLMYPNSSLAERLQQALPATLVVKTLNTMLFAVMAAPGQLGSPPVAFLSGNHAGAKAVVTGLLGDLGWSPAHILDLGGIETARGPEAVVLLVPDILKAKGFVPFAISVVD